MEVGSFVGAEVVLEATAACTADSTPLSMRFPSLLAPDPLSSPPHAAATRPMPIKTAPAARKRFFIPSAPPLGVTEVTSPPQGTVNRPLRGRAPRRRSEENRSR